MDDERLLIYPVFFQSLRFICEHDKSSIDTIINYQFLQKHVYIFSGSEITGGYC